MTKCNKLYITYLTCSTEHLPTLPFSISTISMTVVKTTLFNKCAQCSVKYGLISNATPNRKMYNERGRYVINIYRMDTNNDHITPAHASELALAIG